MSTNATRGFLTESANTMKRMGVNTYSDYRMILSEDALFDSYKQSLAEGLSGEVRESFLDISDKVRESMFAETAYGFSPIAPLTMPIFRKLWPNLVAREALTVMPIDKPEITKSFMRIVANVGGNEVEMPNNHVPVTTGQAFGEVNNVDVPPLPILIKAHNVSLLAYMSKAAGDTTGTKYNSSNAHIASADFAIVGVTRDDGTTSDIYVEPNDDGSFSFEVECNGMIDVISGKIDYFTGVFSISSTREAAVDKKVESVTIVGSMTQAEEMVANRVTLKNTYIKLRAEDHEIQADWTIQFEQDYKAYFGATR